MKPDKFSVKTINLTSDIIEKAEDARRVLAKKGVRVSFSGLIEFALEEMLAKPNLSSMLRQRGVKARRDD